MEHFDKKAQNWDNDIRKIERAKIFAKEITKFIPPDKSMTALEFGCGTGLLSYHLKDNFKTITLVDTSAGMIEVLKEKIAKENIENFYPIQTDILEEQLNNKSFDVIYTLMTLHHIKDLNKVFKTFHSLLKDNGFLCIADLVKEDGSFHPPSQNFDGHHGFEKNELSNQLKANGFEIIYYNIAYTIEKENGDTTKKYPLFLLLCKKNK